MPDTLSTTETTLNRSYTHENELRNLIIPPLSICSISIATPPQLDLAGVPVEQKENLKNLLLSYFSLFHRKY
jgi:hypothetical protein